MKKIIILIVITIFLSSLLSACGEVVDNDKAREINDDEIIYVYYAQSIVNQFPNEMVLDLLFNDMNSDAKSCLKTMFGHPVVVQTSSLGQIHFCIPTTIKDILYVPNNYKITYTSSDTTNGVIIDKWLYYWYLYSCNTLMNTDEIKEILNDCTTKEDSLQKRGLTNSFPDSLSSYEPIINFEKEQYPLINQYDVVNNYQRKEFIDRTDVLYESLYRFEFYLFGGVIGASALDLYNYIDFNQYNNAIEEMKLFDYNKETKRLENKGNKKIIGYYTSDVDDLLLEPVNADRSNSGTSAYDRIIDYYLHPVIYVL